MVVAITTVARMQHSTAVITTWVIVAITAIEEQVIEVISIVRKEQVANNWQTIVTVGSIRRQRS